MAIELTARLTLSSCVSQLTDFYQNTMLEAIIENGMQEISITLCDTDGQVLPYRIYLEPRGRLVEALQIDVLSVQVFHRSDDYLGDGELSIARFRLSKGNMPLKNLFKCALHCAGDFIKFNEKGL